ncbi:inositol-trisphosphate 3-kinase homolog isoform X2 [Oppia nitens]|uniref:inositol-trisphosphate 3-kinase homolog isoform X2 n=1 Tax=Oppia nitens TaxID=1686743 RepID=UPI0023D9B585|nr:inositol-trisphosphate 3-kinase homolog isoform X2 [Oppia nitens]
MSMMSIDMTSPNMASLVTQFPPVTYSSSFVSFVLIQAANESDIVEEEKVKNETIISGNNNKKSPQISTAKSRWKALARSAFVRNLRKTAQTTNSVNNETKHNSHTNGVIVAKSNHLNETHQNSDSSSSENECEDKDYHLLELLALKSLQLSAPASDIILKNRTNNWVQLSGHEGSFALAGPGTIWKKRSTDDTEVRAYEALMQDSYMCEMVPKFFRHVSYMGDYFIEIEDLLYEYKDAAIMDIKMGTRTFLEEEVKNRKPRNDLYEKMIKIDANAPTDEEHRQRAVTKLTYMKFREALSSSSNLGFRIEGFKAGEDLQLCKDLKLVKHRDEVRNTLKAFLMSKRQVRHQLIDRLKQLADKFESSEFFRSHEVIGSSLLIIHNGKSAGVWMIDFAKTIAVPKDITIDHKSQWALGNHEDGYLFGLNNLIDILEECADD